MRAALRQVKRRDNGVQQYAALPWRMRAGRPEYVLITSRRTGRWIFPKGSREPDETPAEAARREAEEEAGLTGRPGTAPVGRYAALKVVPGLTRWLTVELWPVEITEMVEDWAERERRQRRVVDLVAARELLVQSDMRALLQAFHARLISDRTV